MERTRNEKVLAVFLVGVVALAALFLIGPFIMLGGSQLIHQLMYSEKRTVASVERVLTDKYGEPFTVDRNSVHYINTFQEATMKAHPDRDPQITVRIKVELEGQNKYTDDYMLNSAVNQIVARFCEYGRCWVEANFSGEQYYTKTDIEHFDVNRLKDDEALSYLQANLGELSLHTYMNLENKARPLDFAGIYQFILYLKTHQTGSRMNLNIPDGTTNGQQQEMYKQEVIAAKSSGRHVDDYVSGDLEIEFKNINSEKDLIAALMGKK